MPFKCKHEWKNVPQEASRSYQDQKCIYCGIKQMQAAAVIQPTISKSAPVEDERYWNEMMGTNRRIYERRGGAIRQKYGG